MEERNPLHHTRKEQDVASNTENRNPHSFIDKERVTNAIKDYQKQKIQSFVIKENPKVINNNVNSYQDENHVDEDTTKKAYPEQISSKRRWVIRSGHQYKRKKKGKEVGASDYKEQHLHNNEEQEGNEESFTEKESVENGQSNEKETTSNENIFTEDEVLEIYEHNESGKQLLKENVIDENQGGIQRKQQPKSSDKAESKKRTHRISKKKKRQLLEKFKNKRTGDGSIDKENEANAIMDSVAKAKDLTVIIPQTAGQVKDKTVLIATGTVHTVYQTAVDIKRAASNANISANKINGLIKKRQYQGVHQSKKQDSQKIVEKNKTSHNRLRNTSKNAKKNKKENTTNKTNHGIMQDIRRKTIQVITTPESATENNMKAGVSDFVKGQAEKYAQSKMREWAAKAGKAAFVYTGKLMMMLLKFAITMIVQAITFIVSLVPLLLLPIFIIVVIVGLFSYFFGGAEVDSTNPSYVAVKLNDTYDAFEDRIAGWERKNKQGVSGYNVIYEQDCSELDNFNEVLNLYLVYSIEAQAAREDYLFIDTNEEEERLDKAFALLNYTYTTDEDKTLHVVKQSYEEVADSLSDTLNDYYVLALQAHSIGEEEGHVIDKRIKKENSAKKALENSPQGTLPMSYDELKEIFTWMNEDNIYPIDDGGVRYVTSQYTLARTDIDENHTTHYGVDFTSGKGIGANLVAIAEASVYKIVHVEEDGTGYGNHLILRFDDGTYALYAHMNDFITAYGTNAEYDEDGYMLRPATDEEYLHEGDHVQAGDIIGHMGNTGDSFGAHLHLVLSTDAYGTGEGSRYDFNDYVSCVWVKDFDYSYDY